MTRRQILDPSFSLDDATLPNAEPPRPAAPEPPAIAPALTPPPVDEPAPAGPQQPATTAQPPARPEDVDGMSGSANKLTTLLAGKDETDTGYSGGDEGLVEALLTRPPIDPELKLVQTGWRIPEYFKEAIRLIAFASRTTEQAVAVEALRHGIDPAVLTRARRAAADGR